MPVDGFLPVACVPVIAGVALALGAVSRSGALAGALIGFAITMGAGWTGLFMLAMLLFVGTACSTRGRRDRDGLQALCNGGAAACAALAAGFSVSWGAAAMAGALATALSDTVAGELGQRFGGRPRMLLFGPVVQTGADGGMSYAGTLLGAMAALLIPLLGWADDLPTALLVGAAAFCGNLLDSVLGVVVQPRLGVRGNDWTNLIATTCGGALAALLVAGSA